MIDFKKPFSRIAIAALTLAFGAQAHADFTWGTSTPGGYFTNYSATGNPTTLTAGQTLDILSNTGDAYLDVNLVNSGGTINDQGIFSPQSPSVSFTNSSGKLIFAQNSGIYGYGCSAGGSGCSAFTNAGTLVVSGSGVSTAYTQFSNSGVMAFNLSSSSVYGSIALGGSANTLGGQFAVNLQGGFVPTVGETFEVLTAGGYGGTFANTSFITDGATFDVNYSSAGVDLTVASVLATSAPEIDPASATSGIALLGGVVLLISGRRAPLAVRSTLNTHPRPRRLSDGAHYLCIFMS